MSQLLRHIFQQITHFVNVYCRRECLPGGEGNSFVVGNRSQHLHKRRSSHNVSVVNFSRWWDESQSLDSQHCACFSLFAENVFNSPSSTAVVPHLICADAHGIRCTLKYVYFSCKLFSAQTVSKLSPNIERLLDDGRFEKHWRCYWLFSVYLLGIQVSLDSS